MPKLPFKGFPGAAHYRVAKDKYVLRYRLLDQDRFHEKASDYRASRNEKRPFLEWSRKFLFAGGKIPDDWVPTGEADVRELAKADESILLGEAIKGYLEACGSGNKWMKPRAAETLSTVTRPILGKLEARCGDSRPLASITGDEIAEFVRKLGGRKETKERHLCPISGLFEWAIREGHLSRANPAHGIVFWRESGEEPPDGVRKSYTDEELSRLIDAAQTDPLALDAVYLCRYLALRPQDAVMLRWEDWHWDQLFVAVRRIKTRESGIEVSHVDIHPTLHERYGSKRGATGYCLEYAGKVTKIVWPPAAELTARVEAANASAVARELGVTETAVRKRLARPSKATRVTAKPVSEEAERRALADSISQRVSRITKAAGLSEEKIQPVYVLRHTFASDSLRRGVPPSVVAREMGISVLTLEKFYWHVIPRGELDGLRTNRWGLSNHEPTLKGKKAARSSRSGRRSR